MAFETPSCLTSVFGDKYYIIGLNTPGMDRDLYGAEIL